MIQRRLLLPLFGLAAVLTGLNHYSSAQQTQPKTGAPQSTSTQDDKDDIVRITTNLVQVDVVVTKNGKGVTGLTADDFEIFEDGRKQAITNFTYISNVADSGSVLVTKVDTANKAVPPIPPPVKPTDARRIMALVVDDLGLSAESMGAVRKQLGKFVDQKMQPNDLVAIIRTGADIGALQQFTNDKRLLQAAIKQAKWNICSRVGPTVFAPLRSPIFASVTDEMSGCGWRSVQSTLTSLRFVLQAMGQLPGRKSLVIFSDSIPRQEQEVKFTNAEDNFGTDVRNNYGLLQRLAEIAIRNSIVIYGVDTQGLQYTGPTAADQVFSGRVSSAEINNRMGTIHRTRSAQLFQRREGADILSRETGGFLVRNSNDFKIDDIMDDQRGYYLIGYRPTDETFNRRFHRISAKVKGSGLTLRTRKGFYGFTEDEAERVRVSDLDQTNLALVSPFRANDIATEVATIFADDPTLGPILRSYLFLEGKKLTFAEEADGRQKLVVEIRGVIFGNNGRIIEQVTLTPTVRLGRRDYEFALLNGLGVRFDIPVKRPGAYQLRVAAKDIASSRMGSAGQFVTVPNLTNRQLAVSGILLRAESGNEVVTVIAPPISKAATETKRIDPEVSANLALRRFAAGSNLLFGIAIYNAIAGVSNPKLNIEAKLFYDDKPLITTGPMPVDMTGQKDGARIFARGMIRLPSDLEPGRYYLQLLVTDSLAKEKQPGVMQWIDFEVLQR